MYHDEATDRIYHYEPYLDRFYVLYDFAMETGEIVKVRDTMYDDPTACTGVFCSVFMYSVSGVHEETDYTGPGGTMLSAYRIEPMLDSMEQILELDGDHSGIREAAGFVQYPYYTKETPSIIERVGSVQYLVGDPVHGGLPKLRLRCYEDSSMFVSTTGWELYGGLPCDTLTNPSRRGNILNIQVIMPEQNQNDEISIVTESRLVNSSCYVDSFSVSKYNNEIMVEAFYHMGLADGICKSTDTVTLKSLNEGTYNLVYHAHLRPEFPGTGWFGSDTLSFEVTPGTAIESPVKTGLLHIYPNPVTNHYVHIDFPLGDKPSFNLALYDLSGREVWSYNSASGTREVFIPVDVSTGIYIMKLQTERANYGYKLIIQ
jgi:hypothetical protein